MADGAVTGRARAGERQDEDGSSAPPALGRPRDPDLERRAMTAALEVYGTVGWSGYTLGKVAARAHLGKSSLYRRWSDKSELLLDAFNENDAFFAHRLERLDGLPFVLRIRRMVRDRLSSYFTPVGLAVLRINMENQADPDGVGEVWSRSVGRAVLRTRGMIHQAIQAGELRPDTSVVHLGDALEGAMIMHALATPRGLRDRTIEGLDDYADALVDRVVAPWLTEAGRVDDFDGPSAPSLGDPGDPARAASGADAAGRED